MMECSCCGSVDDVRAVEFHGRSWSLCRECRVVFAQEFSERIRLEVKARADAAGDLGRGVYGDRLRKTVLKEGEF